MRHAAYAESLRLVLGHGADVQVDAVDRLMALVALAQTADKHGIVVFAHVPNHDVPAWLGNAR
jgi:hypothetical protein